MDLVWKVSRLLLGLQLASQLVEDGPRVEDNAPNVFISGFGLPVAIRPWNLVVAD